MANATEFTDKTPEQKEQLSSYLDAQGVARDYCLPYFNQFVRYYRLFSGQMPPELDGTFSKIMLYIAFSMVENEIPKQIRSLLSTTDWFNLEALSPMYEDKVKLAKKWLRYQMERKQRIGMTIIPTLQAGNIFGVGYRDYGHRMREVDDDVKGGKKMETIISGVPLNVFNFWPMPSGTYMNIPDDESDVALDGAIKFCYLKQSTIENNVNNYGWDKNEAGKMFNGIKDSGADPTKEFKDQLGETDATGWKNYNTPAWMREMSSNNKNLAKRYRAGYYMQRETLMVVGEDRYVLYSGAPQMGRTFTTAKFTPAYDLDYYFGKGLIEVTEDLIISMLMLINNRFDYLAGTLHPHTWVSEKVLEHLGGDTSKLDPEPYKVTEFPSNITDIRNAIYHDRFPEISQQAFMEDSKLDEWMQKITGQTNFGKGMAGANEAAMGGGASGVMSMLQAGMERSFMRAINIEEGGLRDSLRLTLQFADKYVQDDELIRESGVQGFPWLNIPSEALADKYWISIAGTRAMSGSMDTFRKMMDVARVFLALPPGIVDNPKEMARQIIEKSDAFEDVSEIVGNMNLQEPMPLQLMQGGEQIPGQGELQNMMRSVEGRNTVGPQLQTRPAALTA